jgi:signal transduction histidine kinase
MAMPRQRSQADRGRTGSAGARPGTVQPGQAQHAKATPARTRSIRSTLVGLLLVPLVALVGLWSFVASTTLGNALSEHNYNRATASDSAASTRLLAALEQERLQTFLWLTSPRRPPTSQLAAIRRADDAAIASYEASSAAEGVPPRQALIAALRKIPGIRGAMDSGRLSAPAAFQAYSDTIDGVFAAYAAETGQSDVSLFRQTLAAIDAGRAAEQFTRELAVTAAAALNHGRLSAADGLLFAKADGDQSLLMGDAITLSDGQMHASLQRFYTSPTYTQITGLEDRIAASAGGQALSPGTLQAWGAASKAFLTQFLAVTQASSEPLAVQEGQASNRLFREAGLAGGLGLLAVLGSIFLMVRFGRTIRKDLTSLHDDAEAMANRRLPHIIARLRNGDEVDVAAESPPLDTGTITEIARVAEAFSAVQRTAVDAAVGQANLRRGVNRVFLNLSMRNQSLLHRQLSLLDTMERAAEDPAALADLFRLDHLTTRMRRHAESLIILSGATPGRSWRDPVPIADVLSAAIAEVEDYVRVEVISESTGSVTGPAANDVVHLTAELVENATSFSPPNSPVEIRADTVGIGIAVQIEDRGLGLTTAELAEINARLASPPEFDLARSDQLGLFVVAQLAARHGIRVSLRESAYGGTTAIVLLPHRVIVRPGEVVPAGPVPAGPGPAGQHLPARVNGVSHPAGTADPVASGDPASAFNLHGRHRFRAVQQAASGSAQPAAPGRPGHGLPRRVRQASMAPQLRRKSAGAEVPGVAQPATEPVVRSAEDLRSMMSSLQDGWQRGRIDDLNGPDEGLGGRPGAAPDARDGNDGEA